jgi:hypothetical protein
MKRLALSLLGGITIPFLYAIVFGPLSTQINNEFLKHYLGYPVRWPVLILYRLAAFNVLEHEVAMIVLVIVSNVAVYSLLTYAALVGLSKRKESQRLPPPPDQFLE